ncbi:hypothetical protein BC834DRAFT_41667 [Gloeopeniophorella convolvens]|nr:hypothetical protein BC834DRAFT_41667 [Gloeopeniophorella convolvens]
MASTTSSTPRLSRSVSDRPDNGKRKSSASNRASSSRKEDGKATLPLSKIQALEQFVKFGRKGKQKEKEKDKQKPPEFPPPSWFDDSSPSAAHRQSPSRPAPPFIASTRTADDIPARPPIRNASTSQTPTQTPELSRNSVRRSTPETGVDLVNAAGTTASLPPDADQPPTIERRGASFPGALSLASEELNAPEPITLARRIQALLGSRSVPPTPAATDGATSYGATSSDTAGPVTPGGPVPPVPVTPDADSRFLALLGNTNIMTGSLDKGRQSVFAILDRLRRPSARAAQAPTESAPSAIEEEGSEDDEEGSIMLYGPIVPSEDSEVELAASDIMSVFDDGETLEFGRPARPMSFFEAAEQLTPRSPLASLDSVVPSHEGSVSQDSETVVEDTQKKDGSAWAWFDTVKDKMVEGGKLVSDKVTEGSKSLKGKVSEGRKVVKTKTRWVPSPDKISFQATWWGYRLYLPPPVLDVLNNKRLEAAKRAAILTTALQWLLGHVPLTVVPPQFRPGLLIAQRLVPYLGYIGGFVAWSWGAMRSFDKGCGIVLTATWLLPVALIPGTWEANEAAEAFPQAETALEFTPVPPSAAVQTRFQPAGPAPSSSGVAAAAK